MKPEPSVPQAGRQKEKPQIQGINRQSPATSRTTDGTRGNTKRAPSWLIRGLPFMVAPRAFFRHLFAVQNLAQVAALPKVVVPCCVEFRHGLPPLMVRVAEA